MDRLKKENMNVFYKDKLTPPPSASRLQGELLFCVCRPFPNRRVLVPRDGGFIGIDATHNVTHFRDVLLFTIIARDRWAMVRKFNFRGSGVPAESTDLSGLGVPVTWMLTSSGTTDTIAFFVC